MAKKQKSKLLAMALCASVMTGIYASPVFAGDATDSSVLGQGVSIEVGKFGDPDSNKGLYVYYTGGNVETEYRVGGTLEISSANLVNALEGNTFENLTIKNLDTTNLTVGGKTINLSQLADVDLSNVAGIERIGTGVPGEGVTTIEKTLSVDKWGLKVLDENGESVAYINSTTGGITAAKDNFHVYSDGTIDTQGQIVAANGKFHVYSEGQIEGTALSLMNNGAQNVLIDNSGTARFGAVDGNNVRIENGVLYVNRNNEQVAALGENGLTLTSSNDIRATLDAEQIANLNSTIKEGGVVDAKELNVTGATGGLYVKDVTNNDGVTGTMIYTKAADGKTNTMWIDPNTGNLNTVGSIGVGSNLAQPVTQINGIADANGDGIGDINVGISYNKDGSVAGKKINLDASTGNINLVDGAKVDGVDVSELSKNVGDIGADLGDNGRLGGITRTD